MKAKIPTPGKLFWSYLVTSFLLTAALGMYLAPLASIAIGYVLPLIILGAIPLVKQYGRPSRDTDTDKRNAPGA